MHMKNMALIILNYNDAANVICLLNKVVSYQSITHIIVVDNASTDNSCCDLQRYATDYDKIVVLKSDKNLGYARGNNLGMRYAVTECQAEFLVIANPDVQFEETTLTVLTEIIEGGADDIGLVTARMISGKSYGGCGAWKQPSFGKLVFNNLLLLKKVFGDSTKYSTVEMSDQICQVDVVAGSFFVCKSSVMQDVDFFDEQTFLYGEENILAYKLKEKNFQNLLCNQVSYMHEHSASIDKNISSLRIKFGWLYDSLRYYNQHYLKTNRLQDFVFYLTFQLGLSIHILLKRVFRR